MRWVTRSFPHIDRTASAWLIKKFIDPEAEFYFINWPEESLKECYGTPFDIKGVELGHHLNKCTFETIMEKFGVKDPIVQKIASLVHKADLEGSKKEIPEAKGIKLLFSGLRLVTSSNYETIEIGFKLWDAVYAYFLSKEVEEGHKEEVSRMSRAEKLNFLRRKVKEVLEGKLI